MTAPNAPGHGAALSQVRESPPAAWMPGAPGDGAMEDEMRARLWQFRSGTFFEPGWTGNELIDARHERDLLLDGARPAWESRPV